jgi:hypothetical protein
MKAAKRSYKETKLKQVLKASGHKAADVDKEKATTKDDAKQTLKKLLKISDEQWRGCGL